MKILKFSLATCLALALAMAACTQKEKVEENKAAVPPDQVVLKFFNLLAQGGKLTLKEAHSMTTTRFGVVDADSFRKWVQNFDKGTKIKILETKTLSNRTSGGFYLATVKMEVATPSLFGGDFKSSSQMNLILDEESNEWKIDFLAETNKYENEFKNAPVEAKI